MALYSILLAQIGVNDQLSYLSIRNGYRYGCSLANLLYAFTTEPLAITLGSNTDVKGITNGHKNYNLTLYADNLLLYFSSPIILERV